MVIKKINKTKIIILFSSLIIASLLSLALVLFFSRDKNIVVAKVNDEKIYYHELKTKLDEVLDSTQNNNNFKVEDLPQEALIILTKEVYLEKIINKKIKKSDIENFDEIEQKAQNYKNILLRRAFLEELMNKDVDEEVVKKRYMELLTQTVGKKEYLLEQIVLKNENDANLVFKKFQQNKSDNNFLALKKKYSLQTAKNTNYIFEDNLAPEIAEFVIDGNKGEVSEPIKTSSGWRIVKIKDFRDAKTLEFDEVKEELTKSLKKQALEKFYFGIVKDAKIKILIKTKGDFATQEAEKKREIDALKHINK